MLACLEELYELYYHLAKEENHERSNKEIEQMMLRAMTILANLPYELFFTLILSNEREVKI